MRNGGEGSVVRDLGRLLRGGVDVADGELLRRFLAHGDGDAFEAIVIRHGPMVRGVCGRLLRDPHDADDAFQATFLVLARDGRKLRDPGRLASWLYTAARRVSLRARSRSARRRAEPLVADVAAPEDRRGEWSDVLPILDAELARLPSAQRDVLTLCLLGGASEQEAARRLDCPVGTIKSRLSRGRDVLRGWLVRRGVAPAVALAASSSTGSFASVVPETLIRAAVAAASAGGPIPPAVATLARGSFPMLAKSTILAAGLGLLGWPATWSSDPPQGPNGQAPKEVPSPARRAKDEHLQRIGRALQGHAAYAPALRGQGIFPPQALRSGDGRPILSWRVALLPYLGQEELYKEFHLDEPWDSPHNRQFIPLMPDVYQTPDVPTPPGETRIQALWGPGAVFNTSRRGRQVGEIIDALSETAMVGVADAPVTWTEPDDMAFNYPQYLPDLDASDPRGFTLLMADGSVRFVPEGPTRSAFLAALLTPAGLEVLDMSRQTVVGRRPPPATIDLTEPAPAVAEPQGADPTSRSVEARLGRLEEKMDRLLRKLEAAGDPGP